MATMNNAEEEPLRVVASAPYPTEEKALLPTAYVSRPDQTEGPMPITLYGSQENVHASNLINVQQTALTASATDIAHNQPPIPNEDPPPYPGSPPPGAQPFQYPTGPPQGYPQGPPQGYASYPPPMPTAQPPAPPPQTEVTSQPQPQPVQRTIIITEVPGDCPKCRVGFILPKFTLCGICMGIWLFPCGLICMFTMREKRCTSCGHKP